MAAMLKPPVAEVRPTTRSHHGYDFVDNYEWMREKDAPETRAYLEAENAYAEEQTSELATLREHIFQEVKSRVKETDMSVPTRMGDYWYFARTFEGKSYASTCRVPAEGSDLTPPVVTEEPLAGEEVLLDLNALAEGHEYFALGASSVTRSGNLLAYSTDTQGDERFTLRIRDLRTGELLDDVIPGIFYGATWVGEEYLFYLRVDESWRPSAVWRHKVGTPVEADVCVFEEDDPRYGVDVGITRSERFVLIQVASKITSETWVLPAEEPEGEFACLFERKEGREYWIDHAVVEGEDRWLIVHNDAGPNCELAWAPVDAPNEWTTLMPYREDVRIEGAEAFAGQIVVGYRSGAIGRLAVMRLDPGFGEFEELAFDEELYSASLVETPEWDSPLLRVSYASFTNPGCVFDLEVATGQRTVRKEVTVHNYNPEDYVASREWAVASDGVRIPISVIRRRDLDMSKPNPTVLYGYGSYEHSIDPGCSVLRLSMLDRGMVFAIAHVRGGGEMGRVWYDTGKTTTKMNTFTDFVAAADYLIEQGCTTPEQLAALGGSAGGLLMGVIANIAGDRFAAIQAAVPFVDPLTSMLMPELPLTAGEWEEWGNPLEDREIYEYMASYAPYENVEAKAYPNILATTSLNDTRVLYVEPAKWIARLRAVATEGSFLLKTEMVAGHGGVSGRYEQWRQAAFEFAWIINQVTGLKE